MAGANKRKKEKSNQVGSETTPYINFKKINTLARRTVSILSEDKINYW